MNHPTGYFHRLHRSTGTRLWINNPTSAEIEAAIGAGAVNCTSNPTYAARLIGAEPEVALPLIDQALRESTDDRVVAGLVQERIIARTMERFAPLWDAAPRAEGFVSIQGDPELEDDPAHIVHEMRRARALGRNVLAKVPATAAGLTAIEALIADDMPFIATEVFSLSQAVATCERYERVSRATGKRPPFFLTHISGIFDDYLRAYVQTHGVDISPDLIRQAGVIVARAQYRLVTGRGYGCTLLGGGARGAHHFTELVGGAMHITVNWSTVDEILKADPPIIDRIHTDDHASVVAELVAKLPDLRAALVPGAQRLEEFADYGPVRHFRAAFTKGWQTLMKTIGERRAAATAAVR